MIYNIKCQEQKGKIKKGKTSVLPFRKCSAILVLKKRSIYKLLRIIGICSTFLNDIILNSI